jgi:hypothetical protein
MRDDSESWAVDAGRLGELDPRAGSPGISLLQVVVPDGSITNLKVAYAAAAKVIVQGTASWMVDKQRKLALVKVQILYPTYADFVLTFDLLDPSWRTMLKRMLLMTNRGDFPAIVLVPTEKDLDITSDSLYVPFGENDTRAFALPLDNVKILGRVQRLEEELSDDEWALGTALSREPIARHLRHSYPLLVDIVPERGGAFGLFLGEWPVLVIDLGYYDDGLWAESAIQELVDLGFTRPSTFDSTWPTAKNFFAVVMEYEISILYSPQLGGLGKPLQLRTLYSGVAAFNRRWREKVMGQGGVPVMVANLNIMDVDQQHRKDSIEDAILFQRAAGASVPVLDVDLDDYTAMVPVKPGDVSFERKLCFEWSLMLLRRSTAELGGATGGI